MLLADCCLTTTSGSGFFIDEFVLERLRVEHLLCEGYVVGVGDGEGHVESAAPFGVVVNNIVARDVRIRDYNALVVSGRKHRVHQLYLVNPSAYVLKFDEVAAFKRLVDEYLYAAGKLGDAVLQTHAGGQSRRAEGGDERVQIEAESRERGEYDRKSQQPDYDAAQKRVDGCVNALSRQTFYQQFADKRADPEAERDYYHSPGELWQRVDELRHKCFKIECREFFRHIFFLRFGYVSLYQMRHEFTTFWTNAPECATLRQRANVGYLIALCSVIK